MGEAENRRRRQCGLYLAVALLCSCWFITARGDFAADQKECAPSLTGLMTCLDYVEGRSDAPPQDCCSGLLQVIVDSRRCLCVLIKDRNEPQLPFKINATRAISLPYICLSSTNITECIGNSPSLLPYLLLVIIIIIKFTTMIIISVDLLKMDPTSPEAQIFKQNVSLSNSTSNGKSVALNYYSALILNRSHQCGSNKASEERWRRVR